MVDVLDAVLLGELGILIIYFIYRGLQPKGPLTIYCEKSSWLRGQMEHIELLETKGIRLGRNKETGSFSTPPIDVRRKKLRKVLADVELPEGAQAKVAIESSRDDFENVEEIKVLELKNGSNVIVTGKKWKGQIRAILKFHRYNFEDKNDLIVNSFELQFTEIEPENEADKIKAAVTTSGTEDLDLNEFEIIEKDLECEYCGEKFKTDIGLQVHVNVRHKEMATNGSEIKSK